jgi:hypothetical protein
MSIVTLTTDFGDGDYASGLLHGVVLSLAPNTEVVDLTHTIPRHDVAAGALALERALPYFPPGTVHVVVVDPGVGTQRRPLAAQLGDQFFVGPDNGLVTYAYQRSIRSSIPCRFCHMNQPSYWLESPSHIFHGRDIFTPAAAHLSNGVAFEKLGILIDDPILIDVPGIIQDGNAITGQVTHVDHFGNLSTNIKAEDLSGRVIVRVSAGGKAIPGLATAFQDARDGGLVALIDSSNNLSICVANGNAQKQLLMETGDTVTVLFL